MVTCSPYKAIHVTWAKFKQPANYFDPPHKIVPAQQCVALELPLLGCIWVMPKGGLQDDSFWRKGFGTMVPKLFF